MLCLLGLINWLEGQKLEKKVCVILEFFIYVLTVWFFENNSLGWKLWKFYISFLRVWGNHLWILENFRGVFYELWIFDWYLSYKSVKNHDCCTNFCEIIGWEKNYDTFIVHDPYDEWSVNKIWETLDV